MHRDVFHDARAHYGIKKKRYKLIYWYNQGFGLPGTRIGGGGPEWELFDCDKDLLELVNICGDAEYNNAMKEMTAILDRKMVEIGDELEQISK